MRGRVCLVTGGGRNRPRDGPGPRAGGCPGRPHRARFRPPRGGRGAHPRGGAGGGGHDLRRRPVLAGGDPPPRHEVRRACPRLHVLVNNRGDLRPAGGHGRWVRADLGAGPSRLRAADPRTPRHPGRDGPVRRQTPHRQRRLGRHTTAGTSPSTTSMPSAASRRCALTPRRSSATCCSPTPWPAASPGAASRRTACIRASSTRLRHDTGGLFGAAWGLIRPFLITPEKGARTSLRVATAPDLDGITGATSPMASRRPPPGRARAARGGAGAPVAG